jgi:hypothetical protein
MRARLLTRSALTCTRGNVHGSGHTRPKIYGTAFKRAKSDTCGALRKYVASKLALWTIIFASAIILPAVAQAPNISPQQGITVCEGEYEARCPSAPPHEAYTYCGTINAWAQQACRVHNSPEPSRYRLIPLASTDGNKCGYGVWKVICD